MKTTKLLLILKFILTLIGSIVALLFPIILYHYIGFKSSISQYATVPQTNMVLMFSLILIAISLLTRRKLVLTSILLLLIGILDVSHYEHIHSLIAILFFIHITFVMIKSELKVYGVFMLINLISLSYGLYLFEINSIFLIVGFHLHMMSRICKKEYKEIFIKHD